MPEQRPGEVIEGLVSELQGMDSKIKVVAQRMKIIEKNEQIIGKTLISHGKEIKELTALVEGLKSAAPEEKVPYEDIMSAIADIKKTFSESQGFISKLKDDVEVMKRDMAGLRDGLNEAKYVLETINPVAYVTFDQVADLIDEKIEEMKRKKEKEES